MVWLENYYDSMKNIVFFSGRTCTATLKRYLAKPRAPHPVSGHTFYIVSYNFFTLLCFIEGSLLDYWKASSHLRRQGGEATLSLQSLNRSYLNFAG